MPVSAPEGGIVRSDGIQREHWVVGQVKVVLLKRQPRDAGLPSEGGDLLSGFFRSRGCHNWGCVSVMCPGGLLILTPHHGHTLLVPASSSGRAL